MRAPERLAAALFWAGLLVYAAFHARLLAGLRALLF